MRVDMTATAEGLCAPAGFRASRCLRSWRAGHGRGEGIIRMRQHWRKGLEVAILGDWWEWCHLPWALCVSLWKNSMSADINKTFLTKSFPMYSFAVLARVQCRKWRGYNTGNTLLGESLEELEGWAPGQASENVTSRTPWNRSPQELPSLPVSGKWQSGGCPLKPQQENTFVAVITGNHSSHGCCHHNCLKFEI